MKIPVFIVASLFLSTLCEILADSENSTSLEIVEDGENVENFTTTIIPDLVINLQKPARIEHPSVTDKSLLQGLTKVGKFIYLPKDYDPIEDPPLLTPQNYPYYNSNTSTTTIQGDNWFHSFYFVILDVLDIDEDLGIVHLEVRGTYHWQDTRLVIDNSSAAAVLEKYGSNHDDQRWVEIPIQILNKLWRPEFFIQDVLSSTVPLTGRMDASNLRYYSSGLLKVTTRILVKIPCEFDFTYYPADVQTCHINVVTKAYPQFSNAHFRIIKDDNFQYNLKRIHYPGERPNQISVDLIVRRKLTYHLFQTYFLSVFFVIVTWLCVLISPDMVELRIAIALSTLLSLTTMFTSVKEETPKVSYIKAIDVWMVACISFIFTALAGFTTTAWVKRSLKHLMEGGEQHEIEGLVRKSFIGKSEDKKIQLQKFYKSLAIFVERVGVYILSGMVICFNIFYWTWLFTQSEYFKVHLAEDYVRV